MGEGETGMGERTIFRETEVGETHREKERERERDRGERKIKRKT